MRLSFLRSAATRLEWRAATQNSSRDFADRDWTNTWQTLNQAHIEVGATQ